MSNPQGRLLLANGAQVALSALSRMRPESGWQPVPVSGEIVTLAHGELDRLRLADGRHGAVGVMVPIARQADHLIRMLCGTKQDSALRRRVAAVAFEAADLAGWVAYNQGDYTTAQGWYLVAEEAARHARSADLVALAVGERAWTLLNGLDRVEAAAGVLSAAPLAKVSPMARAYLYAQHAEALARLGREHPARTALEAAHTARAASGYDDAPSWMRRFVASRLVLCEARCDLSLGYAELGYGKLEAALHRQPGELYRSSGALHLGLARAAASMGELRDACDHAARAHHIFVVTRSTRHLRMVRVLRDDALARYAGEAVVCRLDEQLAAVPSGHRYISTPTELVGRRHLRRLHRASCPQLKRSTRVEPWLEGTGRDPADIVADRTLLANFVLCAKCLDG